MGVGGWGFWDAGFLFEYLSGDNTASIRPPYRSVKAIVLKAIEAVIVGVFNHPVENNAHTHTHIDTHTYRQRHTLTHT